MLDFIKKIFQKKRILVSEEDVRIEGLNDWLEEKLSQIDFWEEAEGFLNKIKDYKWVLGEKTEALAGAEIGEEEKKKVEEKIKSAVLGHRDNYVREIRRFLEGLDVPEGKELREAVRFNELLNGELDKLAVRTAKNYQAAQHLFFNPVEEVFRVIGEISFLAKNFESKLEKKGFKRIKEIEEKLHLLQAGKKKKEKLEEELGWKEDKLKRCREGKAKQEAEIRRLKESQEYEEFEGLKRKEEEAKERVEANRDEVFLFFSKLERPLRKYEKITLEKKVVNEYLGGAAPAFFKDGNLKILGVLEGLKKSMDKGELGLDEKEKEAVKELVEKAKKGYLNRLVEEGKKLREKWEEMKLKLRRYTVDRLVEEAEYKLEHFEEQSILTEREIKELKVKLETLEKGEGEKELKELVNEVLGVELNIIWEKKEEQEKEEQEQPPAGG